MSGRKGSVLAVLLMLLAVPAANAAKGNWAFGVTGGGSSPMGDLSDKDKGNFGTGFSIGGAAEYFVTDALGIGVDGAYNSSSNKESSDFKAKNTEFGAHALWMFPTTGSVMPFLKAGVGIGSQKLEFRSDSLGSTEAALSISKSNPEANGGVGVDFKANEQFSIGVEGIYHYGLSKFKLSEVTGDEADDFNWSHISYGARVMWHFRPAGK